MKTERGKEIPIMKKLIPILITIIALVLLSSCIKIYMPENPTSDNSDNTPSNTDIPGDITDDKNDSQKALEITRASVNKDIYPSYNLGKYYGSGFNLELPTPLGKAEYKIIQTYEELKRDTDYGSQVDKSLFEENYILAVKFPHSADKKGLIGFKDFRQGTAGCFVTAVCNGVTVSQNEYFYYQVPRDELLNWENSGIIELRKEQVSYVNSIQIEASTKLMDKDGDILLLSSDELMDFINVNNLSVKITNPSSPYYIAFYSRRLFGKAPSFVEPIISGNTVKLIRDYSVAYHKAESAYLDIIPLNIEDISTINKIEISSELIGSNEYFNLNYQADDAIRSPYDIPDFYKSFRGGVYYGTELKNQQASSYTIIESYRELLDKAEFYVDEEIFKDNYVVVLKLVGADRNRLGFANARIELIDAMEGAVSGFMHIDLYVTPLYETILNGDSNELEDKIEVEDPEEYIPRVEYEYIIVPKSNLRSVAKTGDLNITVKDTFESYTQPSITKKYFNADGFNILPGYTWRITTKLEMEDFNNKYGTNFITTNIGTRYGRECIIVYLEEEYDIIQTALSENNGNMYLSYLIRGEREFNGHNGQYTGYFLCIEREATKDTFDRLYIECTLISSVGTYPSYSVETEVKPYDHYEMRISYADEIDFKYLVLTDYTQFEELFNEYSEYEYDNISADKVFAPSTFENNYVVVFPGYYDEINTYYNARIGGNGALYLYAYENNSWIEEIEDKLLTFISIPKEDLSKPINGIKIQYTKEPIFNGSFENVIISSTNQEDVKLEQKFVLINSENQLNEILTNFNDYKKLQNIDFENYFVLAFNRGYFTNVGYLYGDFVNFKTDTNGNAYITFMQENQKWINTGSRNYTLDLVIIPREYLKHEISFLYYHTAIYSAPFENSELDRLEHSPEYPDILPEELPSHIIDVPENLE